MKETIIKNLIIITSISFLLFLALPFIFVYYTAYSRGVSFAPGIWNSFILSFLTAIISTTVTAIFGIPIAYFLARSRSYWKEVITALITLPLVLPPLVAGIIILSAYGQQSFVGSIFGRNIQITNNISGILVAQIFVISPYLILSARAAFEGMDERLEKASLILGKRPLETFFDITLPLSWPGILSGIIMGWARAMGEFGATVVLTYYPQTLPVKIWADFMGRGIVAAMPGVLIVVTFSFLIIVFVTALKGKRIFSFISNLLSWRGRYAQS